MTSVMHWTRPSRASRRRRSSKLTLEGIEYDLSNLLLEKEAIDAAEDVDVSASAYDNLNGNQNDNLAEASLDLDDEDEDDESSSTGGYLSCRSRGTNVTRNLSNASSVFSATPNDWFEQHQQRKYQKQLERSQNNDDKSPYRFDVDAMRLLMTSFRGVPELKDSFRLSKHGKVIEKSEHDDGGDSSSDPEEEEDLGESFFYESVSSINIRTTKRSNPRQQKNPLSLTPQNSQRRFRLSLTPENSTRHLQYPHSPKPISKQQQPEQMITQNSHQQMPNHDDSVASTVASTQASSATNEVSSSTMEPSQLASNLNNREEEPVKEEEPTATSTTTAQEDDVYIHAGEDDSMADLIYDEATGTYQYANPEAQAEYYQDAYQHYQPDDTIQGEQSTNNDTNDRYTLEDMAAAAEGGTDFDDDFEDDENHEMEISPGVFVPFRGAKETWQAVATQTTVELECLDCAVSLVCINDCEYTVCPDCRVVNPVFCDDPVGKPFGVGMGFKKEWVLRKMVGQSQQ